MITLEKLANELNAKNLDLVVLTGGWSITGDKPNGSFSLSDLFESQSSGD